MHSLALSRINAIGRDPCIRRDDGDFGREF